MSAGLAPRRLGRCPRRAPARPSVDWPGAYYMVVSVIGIGVILFTLGWVLHHFLRAFLLLGVSGVLAYALLPLVDACSARTGAPRWLSTTLVYLALLGVAGGGGYWSGGQLVAQTAALSGELPRYGAALDAAGAAVQARLQALGLSLQLSDLAAQATASVQGIVGELLSRGVAMLGYITGFAADAAVVLFVSAFLVADAHRIDRAVSALAPRRYRRPLRALQAHAAAVLGGYIRGQLLLCLLIGASVGVVCWLLGVRFPLVLGLLGFFFELIPMVGPVLIGIVVGLVALFQSVQLLLVVALFYVALQVVESNLLGPRITGRAVDLPPVVAILAIIGGGELGGVLGALFAVPTAALAARLAGEALRAWKARLDAAPTAAWPGAPLPRPPASSSARRNGAATAPPGRA